MNSASASLTWKTYAGLFFVTLATLMYQILLTRIFSVTMWYHFAFMAISIAMFGMTVGALVVYLRPQFFTQENAKSHLALSSVGFAITAILSFLVHTIVPFKPELNLIGILTVVTTYSVISIPFFFGGIAVTLALTKFPDRVSSLYAVDLVGAGLGCALIVGLFEITDGPTAVFVTAAIIAVGALLFALDAGRKGIVWISLLLVVAFTAYSVIGTAAQRRQQPLLNINYIKGYDWNAQGGPSVFYQKWNAYSNVKVLGSPDEAGQPIGWGISENYPRKEYRIPQLHMVIDNSAGTVLTKWDGQNLDDIDYLKYDVVNLAHHLRRDADTLVVGVGGGRDILSALAFEQNSVTGVEINHDIVGMLRGPFAEYSGNLQENPKVDLVVDEARSHVARLDRKFDIFQVSLIDTWAATAAGAFVLSENGLYTKEGWHLFLDRLKPNGILTFSRWYFIEKPAEGWRLVALAAETLKERGVVNPRDHILAATTTFHWGGILVDQRHYTITILVSNSPFSDEDIDQFETVCEEMDFNLVVTPRMVADDVLDTLTSPGDRTEFFADFELNIAPPTDDNAFFFHMIRLRDIFNRDLMKQSVLEFNNRALTVLGLLLMTVVALTILCVFVPLLLTLKRGSLRGALPHFIYFAGIGAGFMMVEISQMQRLNIFLGHPIYSLAVVLFALLLSSGIGSFLTSGVRNDTLARSGMMRFAGLLLVLVLFGLFTPHIVKSFESAQTIVRLLVAVAIVLPIGLFMGMAFPLGMKMAARQGRELLTPWLWGINGALSVVASVLAICVAIFLGVTVAFWIGFACYAVVALAFVWNAKK